MQAALGLGFAYPATAAALTFDGAVGAADGGVALCDQRMERQFVFGDVGVPLVLADVDHRVELDDAAALFEHRHFGTVVGLPAHQAGNPDVVVRFDGFQWLDLVDCAAEVRVSFPGFFAGGELVLPVLGLEAADLEPEFAAEEFLVADGFAEVVAGVDEGDFLLRLNAGDDVQEIGGCGGE